MVSEETRIARWLKKRRMALLHHVHSIHRSEQVAHVVLYTSLAAGFKEIYVLMGGVVAIIMVVAMFSNVEDV